MSYKDNFYSRNSRKIGEEVCEECLDNKKITYARYGFDELNKIPYDKFVMIPEVLRNSPDYMVMHRKAFFLEVKCCRYDIRLKLDEVAKSTVGINKFNISYSEEQNEVIIYDDNTIPGFGADEFERTPIHVYDLASKNSSKSERYDPIFLLLPSLNMPSKASLTRFSS